MAMRIKRQEGGVMGGAIKFLGTTRHHDKCLKDTENYVVKGCFAMTELGHGSNVKGIETVTAYDSNTGEFVINTPCESAQKYCIGGAANHATQTVVFLQLEINGKNQGVHAFICQIRGADGKICPNIQIADCGHKIGLNGVDNGRIWKEFDNVRIPNENLLNSIADVSPDGEYLSAIKDPDQRFAAFMAALTFGHECREAIGGQGLKTENHVGHLKSEIDVQSTFEGDNNVLMQLRYMVGQCKGVYLVEDLKVDLKTEAENTAPLLLQP
ncbi:acyl-coenzyme A oxidase 3, peroxisomal-like [Pistacia vera]|uniref:acyl-coenzyme A oxidase 3, peroxisomal-like n=1 Tax=Pistacia vera TaxID=55513 RepID=UPI001262C701|nr:acyl-coenzyme A oxidase 3, peroxisomal-like [Pistacia vera]